MTLRPVDGSDRERSSLRSYQSELESVRAQISTGDRLPAPSSDPAAYGRKLRLQVEVSRLEEDAGRLQTGRLRLQEYDRVLSGFTELARHLRALAQRASNAPNSDSRKSMAVEVNGLLEEMLLTANTEIHGEYLLAGSRSQAPAFSAVVGGGEIQAVAYQGDLADPAVARLGERDLRLRLNGEALVRGGSEDLFGLAIELRTRLREGAPSPAGLLDRLGRAEDNLLERRSEVGGAGRYLERLETALGERRVRAARELWALGQVDLAQAGLRLSDLENRYEAVLATVARSSRLSLVDYLR